MVRKRKRKNKQCYHANNKDEFCRCEDTAQRLRELANRVEKNGEAFAVLCMFLGDSASGEVVSPVPNLGMKTDLFIADCKQAYVGR